MIPEGKTQPKQNTQLIVKNDEKLVAQYSTNKTTKTQIVAQEKKLSANKKPRSLESWRAE